MNEFLDKANLFFENGVLGKGQTFGNFASRLTEALTLLDEEICETEYAIKRSLVLKEEEYGPEIVDGFGDVAFLAVNGIYCYLRLRGYTQIEANKTTDIILQRICDANLKKVTGPDGILKDPETGKIMKPPGWKSPTYDDLLHK